MNEELKKALEALIDETIVEIDELKKSRFAASEIKIEGPGDGIDGKPVNGKIEKDEDEKDEDEKDVEKGEGKNKEADPGSVHKAEEAEKSEGKNKEADPGSVHKAEDKKEDDKEKKKDKDAKGGEEHEKEERKAIGKLADLADMDKSDMGYMKGAIKKSQDEVSDLMKSYIDEKVLPLENKLTSLLDLVSKIADQPVAPKGATARFQALTKSADAEEKTLSKSEVSSKLFELKKSGTAVESLDVTKAELGQDLQAIVKKYNLA